jgi:hypothetical protein
VEHRAGGAVFGEGDFQLHLDGFIAEVSGEAAHAVGAIAENGVEFVRAFVLEGDFVRVWRRVLGWLGCWFRLRRSG